MFGGTFIFTVIVAYILSSPRAASGVHEQQLGKRAIGGAQELKV